MKKLMLILVVVLFVVSGASASVDRMYYSGGWQTATDMAPGTYASLAADSLNTNFMFGAKAGGGVDRVYFNGSWQTETDIVSGTYASLAPDAANQFFMLGAKVGGGVDRVYLGNGWQTETNILSGTYTAIAADGQSALLNYGLKAGGGVDRIYYSGGWQTETDMVSGTYSAIAADGQTALLNYGAKAGGGVDRIYYSGGWQTETDMVSGTYTALAADSQTALLMLGAVILPPDGDIDLDYDVDLNDFQVLAGEWLTNNTAAGPYFETLLDDMESYTNDGAPIPGLNSIFEYWQEFGESTGVPSIHLFTAPDPNTNGNGGSGQSLTFEYNNDNQWSEILFVPENPIDLTQYNALKISLYRHAGNDSQRNSYVKFLNGGLTNNEVAAAILLNEDGSTVNPVEEWVDYTLIFEDPTADVGTGHEWVFVNGYTDLSQLDDIQAIMFGVNGAGLSAGQGQIDIDDLELAVVPYCTVEIDADLDDDCDVDLADFAILAGDWLEGTE
jgi:hypothetical protein